MSNFVENAQPGDVVIMNGLHYRVMLCVFEGIEKPLLEEITETEATQPAPEWLLATRQTVGSEFGDV